MAALSPQNRMIGGSNLTDAIKFLILIEIEAQFSLWRLEYETIIDKVTQQSQST